MLFHVQLASFVQVAVTDHDYSYSTVDCPDEIQLW